MYKPMNSDELLSTLKNVNQNSSAVYCQLRTPNPKLLNYFYKYMF